MGTPASMRARVEPQMEPWEVEPLEETTSDAPKMITMHIDPDNIRDVIGKGGSVIQKIVADTGAKIDIEALKSISPWKSSTPWMSIKVVKEPSSS